MLCAPANHWPALEPRVEVRDANMPTACACTKASLAHSVLNDAIVLEGPELFAAPILQWPGAQAFWLISQSTPPATQVSACHTSGVQGWHITGVELAIRKLTAKRAKPSAAFTNKSCRFACKPV